MKDVWVGNIIDKRYTLAYFTFVGMNLILSREARNKKVVALPGVEAEFWVIGSLWTLLA